MLKSFLKSEGRECVGGGRVEEKDKSYHQGGIGDFYWGGGEASLVTRLPDFARLSFWYDQHENENKRKQVRMLKTKVNMNLFKHPVLTAR